MTKHQIIAELEQQARKFARQYAGQCRTPSERAAYADGVKAMAAMVNACSITAYNMAQDRRYEGMAAILFKTYADGLRNIVKASDDLIPPGYEP